MTVIKVLFRVRPQELFRRHLPTFFIKLCKH